MHKPDYCPQSIYNNPPVDHVLCLFCDRFDMPVKCQKAIDETKDRTPTNKGK